MGCSKSISMWKVYSNTILPQETRKKRKTLNRQPSFTPKTTGKRRTKKHQNQQEENINIRAETSKKEMIEAIVKINKTKSWFFEKIKLTDL